MNESSMATALEHRQQGEQFKVMDAPNLPDTPTFPNPVVSRSAALLFGLVLGWALRVSSNTVTISAQRTGHMVLHQAAYAGHHLPSGWPAPATLERRGG